MTKAKPAAKTFTDAILKAVWRNTHRDFRGVSNGVKTIMVYRQGTCLVALADLTDEEIQARLPKAK
jgi:hypothetical protein